MVKKCYLLSFLLSIASGVEMFWHMTCIPTSTDQINGGTMKLFSIFGVILFISQITFTTAHAGDLEDLKQCQVSCSSNCRALALKLKPLVEDAEGCTGASEVTRRCNYHFSGTLAQKCAAVATSVEVLNRCYYHFSNSDKTVICSSAGSVEIVNRCYYHYSNSDRAAECASRGKSIEVVNRCYYHFSNSDRAAECSSARSVDIVNRCYYHFNGSDAAAKCAGAGKSVDHVNSCVRQYGSGDGGLTCIAG